MCVVGGPGDAALAAALADAGARVTLLDASLGDPAATAAVTAVPAVSLTALYAPGHGYSPLRGLLAHHWLCGRDFDHVLLCPPFAAGYYACVARDLGLAHGRTAVWVLGDDCRARQLERTGDFPHGRTDIELDFLERQVLARADGVVSRDGDSARWLAASDIDLPETLMLWDDGRAATLLAGLTTAGRRPPPPLGARGRISVCMPTFNRGPELRAAIGSLLRQTVDDFEVVLVDDGSTDPAALAAIDELRPAFAGRGWRILRQDNAGPAAARRLARRAASGSHLLFMDDDNLALPDEIDRFAEAARSGADILTCIPGRHPDTDLGPPPVAMLPGAPPLPVDWTPVGACWALAVMVNCLGDNNALWRAEVFDALGGHAGDGTFVLEDFHLMCKAVAAGYRLEVVPWVLFLYRRHRQSRSMGEHVFASHRHSLQPWLDLVPPPLRPLVLAARRDWYRRHRQACEPGETP